MSKPQIARTVDLYELLNVSDAAVRRDLEWLEQKGFLKRAHGETILNQHMTFENIYRERKKQIADKYFFSSNSRKSDESLRI